MRHKRGGIEERSVNAVALEVLRELCHRYLCETFSQFPILACELMHADQSPCPDRAMYACC
jgi:hypothetical protein